MTIPKEILPEVLTNVFYSQDGSSTLIMVQYKNSGSSQVTMDAIASIRKIMNKNMLLSGLSAITVDTKDLTNSQAPLYVVIAIALALIALSFTMTSWVLPFVLLAALGTAVIYNMGTNIIFGEISFITKSIAAILQLGVTVDYSVFLMDRFEEEKKHHDTKKDAMAAAIDSTFLSLMGSSLTTVFGFLALCFMSFTLGKDMGLVMAKGVILGVITVVTFLPSLILMLDNVIEKTRHKSLAPKFNKISDFAIKHRRVMAIIFLVLFIPSYFLQNNVKKYYNMDKAIPQDLPSISALNTMKKDFNMATTHFIILDDKITEANINALTSELNNVEGVTNVLSLNSFIGTAIPSAMLPDSIKEICVQEVRRGRNTDGRRSPDQGPDNRRRKGLRGHRSYLYARDIHSCRDSLQVPVDTADTRRVDRACNLGQHQYLDSDGHYDMLHRADYHQLRAARCNGRLRNTHDNEIQRRTPEVRR